MPAILVKGLPSLLHHRLKLEAQRNHRSMNRQVIAILEKELRHISSTDLPPPVRLQRPVDPRWIVKVIREGRENNP